LDIGPQVSIDNTATIHTDKTKGNEGNAESAVTMARDKSHHQPQPNPISDNHHPALITGNDHLKTENSSLLRLRGSIVWPFKHKGGSKGGQPKGIVILGEPGPGIITQWGRDLKGNPQVTIIDTLKNIKYVFSGKSGYIHFDKNGRMSPHIRGSARRGVFQINSNNRLSPVVSILPSLLVAGFWLIGVLFLWLGLFPVLQNSLSQQIIKLWWNSIWAVGDWTDYFKVVAASITVLLIAAGLIGMLIEPFKRRLGTWLIFIGGIGGLALLGALWSGFLDGSLKVVTAVSAGGINSHFYYGLSGEIPMVFSHNLAIIIQISQFGWLKLSLIGFGIWFIGTSPFLIRWRIPKVR